MSLINKFFSLGIAFTLLTETGLAVTTETQAVVSRPGKIKKKAKPAEVKFSNPTRRGQVLDAGQRPPETTLQEAEKELTGPPMLQEPTTISMPVP